MCVADAVVGSLAMVDRSAGYEAVAATFAVAREQRAIGANVIAEWAAALPAAANVLDLGCGSGVPVTRALAEAGCTVWGVDASPTLTRAFAERFPQFQIACADVVDHDFFGRTFDGVVAIGLVFLLEAREQDTVLRRAARALAPGGRLLFTAPHEAVTWPDVLTGRTSVSLGAVAYERVLKACGVEVVATHRDDGDNHYYDGRARETSSFSAHRDLIQR